jgi:hypothetical protein
MELEGVEVRGVHREALGPVPIGETWPVEALNADQGHTEGATAAQRTHHPPPLEGKMNEIPILLRSRGSEPCRIWCTIERSRF